MTSGGPPGTRPLPLIGDTVAFGRDPQRFMTELQRRHGDVAAWSLGPRRQVVVFHPHDVETVLQGTNSVLRKGFSEGFAGHAGLVGATGLPMSEGELWQRQRRLAQPAMHPRRIAGYASTMTRFIAEMLDSWQDGESRDVHRDMVRLTQRIAVRTLFGADVDAADGDAVKRALEEMARLEDREFLGVGGFLPPWVPTPNRSRLRAASARVEELVMAAVDRRRRDDGPGPDHHDDLLAMLLDARDDDGAPMPERQLRDEIHILYVAGHETTSNTLGFAAALLARHPEERQRLEAELDEVLAGRTPGVDDVRRLRYTEAFLKETLRLYPIAPMLPRKVNREFRIRDHVLGPDRDVWVCQWVTHRDGRWWGDDAPVFRPARWLDGSTAGLPRGAWFPFGGGPRVCFGQRFALTEAVLALASVVQRFVLEPLDDGPLEVEGTILAPRGGVPVRLHARRVAAAVR